MKSKILLAIILFMLWGMHLYAITGATANSNEVTGTIFSFKIVVTADQPTITAGAVTGTISACVGESSASPLVQRFIVTGNSLTADIIASAPVGFEVSLAAGSGYSSNVTLPQSGGVVDSMVVYVRSAATDAAGSIVGKVVLSSTGAVSQNEAVTGKVNALPTVNTIANQIVVNGDTTAAINFTGTANTFLWTNNTPGIGLTASSNGNITSFKAINNGSSPVTATITVTPANAGFAYIADGDFSSGPNSYVSVLNTITNKVTSTIPVALEPYGVSVSPDGSRVYVTDIYNNKISVINTATNSIITTIAYGNFTPYGIVVSPDGTRAYTASENYHNVTVINTQTNASIDTIALGGAPFGIAISPDGSRVYVASGSPGGVSPNIVSVINTQTNTVITKVQVGFGAVGIAVSPDGSKVYVANGNTNTVSVISAATNTVTSTITTSAAPFAVVVSPDGSRLYVSNNTVNTVSVFSTTTNTLISNIAVGNTPRGISINPDGSLLYVVNQNSNSVSVINTLANMVIATVAVGASPISLGNFVTGGVSCYGPPVTFTITVEPKALLPAAITFAPLSSQQYGAADFSPGATSTNTVTPITYTSSNTAAATIVNNNVHITGAGTTQITASQAASATYAAPTPVIQSFTVTPAPLTITADNQTKVQGTANPVLTATYTTFVNGDSEANLATPPTLSTTATASSPTGSYPITVSGATDNNYTISYKPGTLNVVSAPAALTLSATTLSPTGATLNGTVNDEGSNTTVQMQYSTAPDMSGAYNVPVSTGTSPILAGTGTVSFTSVVSSLTPSTTYYYRIYGINNYGTTYGNIVSFATPAVPLQVETITFNQPPAQTYGAGNVAPGATSTNTAIPVTYTSSNPAVAMIVNGQIHIITAGTTIITAMQAGSAGYSPATPVMQNFTVTPAPLTVTPGAQTMVYGSAALPQLTLSYKGFLNGDSQSSLTTPATAATPATSTSGTGTYPITATGALDPNYTISYITNTLTITPAALTITANNSSKEYGSGNPDFSAGITGFVNGDGPNSLGKQPKLTTTAGTNSPAGTYPVTAAGAADNNYTITYKPGTLTITPATLIITATNETKVYGKANPYLAVSYSGFVPGDDSTSLSPQPTAGTTATAGSATGSYPITLAGAADNNYTISYKPGTLTITPAPLTITANNQAKFVGTANPPLTITYSGFVNNDSQSNLSTQPTISTTATTASGTGPYPITVSGAKDNNYTITYQNGILTVAPLLVLNPFPAKTYGDPDFNPNATGTNITYSSGNSGVATIVNGDIHITGAGTTVITASSGSVSVQQTLTINKAPLTITANDQTKTYGQANPALTLSYDKFVYSDNAANSLSTQPAISTTATNTSDVGTYPITVSGAAASNYAITYSPGTLSITKATQTITFAPIPGQIEPATYDLSAVTATSGLPLTFTLSNNGIASISGTTLSSTAPGMETVTAGQAGNNDYEAAADVAQTYTIKEPDDGEVVVSQVVSPNGDGINDVLNVINIQNYPDNKLTLINRDGVKIYEATGYNNTSIVFDGHSSITGALQQQGTLLYLLQYRVNGQLKRKTGFTVLRY